MIKPEGHCGHKWEGRKVRIHPTSTPKQVNRGPTLSLCVLYNGHQSYQASKMKLHRPSQLGSLLNPTPPMSLPIQ